MAVGQLEVGQLRAEQRAPADIARKYDRGYGHFTTRQNLQLNWIKLEDAPDALAALAEADMHAMQTSGNVIRNVASTAVITAMLGGTREEVVNAVSNAWIDGQSLRTYRHTPNTGSRKSWAAGDATSRAVRLALMALKGEMGYPSALTAKTWGFYDVLFKGKPFKFTAQVRLLRDGKRAVQDLVPGRISRADRGRMRGAPASAWCTTGSTTSRKS